MTRALAALLIALLAALAPASAEARPGEMTRFPLPSSGGPHGITTGPDGALWFTNGYSNTIGRITTAGQLREFPVPTPGSSPFEITSGPDGNLWFTENTARQIGRITTGGEVTEFSIPEWNCGGATCRPWGITEGPDGNIWFTAAGMFGAIGRVSPAGEITMFQAGGEARGIAVGPDRNLWVAEVVYAGEEQDHGQIVRVTTDGSVTSFPMPRRNWGFRPTDIASGPDGNLWFVGDGIGHIDTSGQITILDSISGYPVSGELDGIVAGPDGNLWFGSRSPARAQGGIGRITPDGRTSLFSVGFGSQGLTVGPDGAIWFTEWAGGGIGRLTPGLAGIEISSARASVRNGRTRLEIACSGGSSKRSRCSGAIKLVTCARGVMPEGACRRGAVLLARERYDLASGRSGVVRLRITRRGAALIKSSGELWVKAVARASLGEGMARSIRLRRGSKR